MVVSAALLIRERGAHPTAIADVLEHSGAPRGSAYHYFPGGRTQLLCEAVDYAGEYMATRLGAAVSTIDALDELFADYRKQLQRSDFRAGCPVVAVTVEAGDPAKPDQATPVIERAAAAFARWRDVIEQRLLTDGVPAPRAGALAMLVLSSFEGAIVIARAREVYARAAKLPGIEVTGADMHIGSQITDLGKMETAFRLLTEFVQTLRADGLSILHIDFGGGLGIPYYMDREAPPAPDAYAAMVKRVTHNLGCTLMFEPGRMIVGNAGILVTRVIYVKHGDAKNFVIIDAAMNDLIRPTLYEAHHDILPVREAVKGARTIVADVVGPVCETGDYLALDRTLPEPRPGDLLAIMTSGAYGAVQSGTYNTRPLVPEVLVKDDQYAVVRPRLDVEALIAMDKPAPWL